MTYNKIFMWQVSHVSHDLTMCYGNSKIKKNSKYQVSKLKCIVCIISMEQTIF